MFFSTDEISYRLIKRYNQKYLRIRISREGEVIVSSPMHMPEREIKRLIMEKKGWIQRNLDRHFKELNALDPLQSLSFNGKNLTVRQKYTSKRKRLKVSFRENEEECLLEGPDSVREQCLEAIRKALKKQAVIQLTEKAQKLSAVTGIHYKKLYLRDQKTRWGSSSGKGNISLNWRIIMLSPETQDYLIIHELCHQRNFNHSPDFWKSVENFCPEYRRIDRELKNQRRIMSLFR